MLFGSKNGFGKRIGFGCLVATWAVGACSSNNATDGGSNSQAGAVKVEFKNTLTTASLPSGEPRFLRGISDWLIPSAHAQSVGGAGGVGTGAGGNGAAGAPTVGGSNCPEGVICHDPDELSLKITAIYVAYDVDPVTGSNVGPSDNSQPDTQAIYASPECPVFKDDSSGTARNQPDLGDCSIDLGHQSSAGKTISASPGYVDLALGSAAVNSALGTSSFSVAPGSYKYLAMDVGSNAVDAPGNGSQDTVAEGTALNFRFKAGDMAEPYEIRRLTGIRVEFPTPLVVEAGDSITVSLAYDPSGVVREVPEGNSLLVDEQSCTPLVDGKRYCLDVSKLALLPSIKKN